jgi:hypothetical protein
MLSVHPNPALYLSPEFVLELALGKDSDSDICARHGVEPGDYAWMSGQDWFAQMVAQKRMELADNGVLFSAKAGMMLEELLALQYKSAITGNLNGALINDLIKQLADITGQRGPKTSAQAGPAGPAFQLNINVSAAPAGDAPRQTYVDVDAQVVETPPTLSIPLDGLPPKPPGFRVPDFKLTPDLVGTASAQQAALANSAMRR